MGLILTTLAIEMLVKGLQMALGLAQ